MPFTQNVLSMTDLLQFQRILPCVIIDKYQDWEFRQRFQYEALKGLIAEDFLSLDDFYTAMDTTQLALSDNLAWKAYKPIMLGGVNPVFRAKGKILKVPGMGWVGRMMATFKLAGFTKIFTDALSIIQDKINLPGSDS